MTWPAWRTASSPSRPLQRSRGPETPVTGGGREQPGAAGAASTEPGSGDPGDCAASGPGCANCCNASTEPGSGDPGDSARGRARRLGSDASTEPGSGDPGDDRRLAARADPCQASTEPGSGDPGDDVFTASHATWSSLQRSRGPETPVTARTITASFAGTTSVGSSGCEIMRRRRPSH